MQFVSNKERSLEQIADELREQIAILEAQLKTVVAAQPEPARSLRPTVLIQIATVVRELECVQDALSQSLADDLEASLKKNVSC